MVWYHFYFFLDYLRLDISMYKVLIVKTSGIGDVIQSLTVLNYLHKEFPGIKVDWIVERRSYDVLKAHPLINKILIVDTRIWKKRFLSKKIWREIKDTYRSLREVEYDYLFDIQGNTKSGLIGFFARCKSKVGFSKRCVPEWTNLLFTSKKVDLDIHKNIYEFYVDFFREFFNKKSPFELNKITPSLTEREKQSYSHVIQQLQAFDHPCFMFVLGSQWENKKLSEKTVCDFLQLLQSKCELSILFIYGSLDEKEKAIRISQKIPQQSVVCGDLSIPTWQAVMGEMKGVFSMDSSGLHLAAVAGVPTFAVFGPSAASVYKPPGECHVAVQGVCPYQKSFNKRCSILRSCTTGSCCKEIDPTVLSEMFFEFYTKEVKGG
jgi:heptosyltransferase-1